MNEVPHYNAFISYRHHPRDIAVAEAIHKGLERFKVPASLKKQGKKIDRIFRDKEELPITSSLTDTITTALRCSDYQIVICSTHLKDSYWVQREIETFLQTHTKDQILTVIVDGEPNEVIPEILTYREVTDPVTGETFREPLEPLSCDWRLPKRKAMKTELPRLAAVLLGCTYNDLIQRQKQYRMQRMLIGGSAALAISLGFAGYFLYSSIRIQENLNQSLRNQSQFLASASETLYENGDRLTAITLALEALPSEGNERPYVVAAEKALSEALMLYDPSSDIISIGAFDAQSLVDSFVLTEEGERLYIQDSRGGITVWDTEQFVQTAAFHLTDTYEELFTDKQGNLVTKSQFGDHRLSSYAPDGTLRWTAENLDDSAFCKDKSAILATTRRDNMNYLLTLDPDTGKEIKDPIVICDTEQATFVYLDSESYYQDLPIPVTLYHSEHTVALLNPAEGTLKKLNTSKNYLHCLNIFPDGRVLLNLSQPAATLNGYVMDGSISAPMDYIIFCYDSQGTRQWQKTLTYYMSCNLYTLEPTADGNVFVQSGNSFIQLDSKTGEILAQCHAQSYPLVVELQEDHAWMFLSDGSIGSFSFEDQSIYTVSYMEAGVRGAEKIHGLYTSRPLNTAVTRYRTDSDDSYTLFEGDYGAYAGLVRYTDNHIVLSSFNLLSVYDLNSRKLLWQDDTWKNYWTFIAFSDEGRVFYTADDTDGVRKYDTATGQYTLLEYPTANDYPFARYTESYLLSGEQLYYTFYPDYGTTPLLAEWNLTTGEYTVHDCYPPALFEDWNAYSDAIGPVYGDAERLLLHASTGQLYALSLADGQCTQLLSDTGTCPAFYVDAESGTLLAAANQTITALDKSLQTTLTIQLPETSAVSLTIHEGIIYALCDDGHIYCYDKNGNFCKEITLSLYNTFYSDVQNLDNLSVPISWTFTADNKLILNADRMGNLIPLEGSTYCADIPYMACYHAETDSFICMYDNKQLIAYDRLTTTEVMARGKEVLGTFELTEDQRITYGLN